MVEYTLDTLKISDVDCVKYSIHYALRNWHKSPAGQYCVEHAVDLNYNGYAKDYLYFIEITGKMPEKYYLCYKLIQNQ
jgi:hypothetical protein